MTTVGFTFDLYHKYFEQVKVPLCVCVCFVYVGALCVWVLCVCLLVFVCVGMCPCTLISACNISTEHYISTVSWLSYMGQVSI